MDLNGLKPDELAVLHKIVVQKRIEVNELVDKYGFTANQLVSRTFEHDIEGMYGRKILKEKEQ